jgi:sugar/nucleoside kinase (ribokinase family)
MTRAKALDAVGIGALNHDYIVQWAHVPGPKRKQLVRVLDDTERVTDDLSAFRNALRSATNKAERVAHGHGGSAFNTIRSLALMNLGLRLGFVGVIGTPPDASSDFNFPSALSRARVDRLGTRRVRSPGTASLSLVSPSGDRNLHTYYTERVASKLVAMSSDERVVAYLARARHIHVSSVFGRDAADAVLRLVEGARAAAAWPISLSIDPGREWVQHAPNDASIQNLLAIAETIFLNDREFFDLSAPAGGARSEAAERIFEKYGRSAERTVILKEFDRAHVLRPKKAVADDVLEQAVLPSGRIADATGAGDVFAAGVLAVALSRRGSEVGGVAVGLRAARRKLQRLGDDGYDALSSLFVESEAPRLGSVFISHAAGDAALADRLVGLLEGLGTAEGVTFCTSVLDVGIPAGGFVTTEIFDALEQAELVFVLVTPRFLRRRFCHYEVGASWALGKEQIVLHDPSIKIAEQDLLLNQRQAYPFTSESGLAAVHQRLVDMNLLAPRSTAARNRQIRSFVRSARRLKARPKR